MKNIHLSSNTSSVAYPSETLAPNQMKSPSYSQLQNQKLNLLVQGFTILILTSVKLVMVYVLFATNAGIERAAYFLPANATIYPP